MLRILTHTLPCERTFSGTFPIPYGRQMPMLHPESPSIMLGETIMITLSRPSGD